MSLIVHVILGRPYIARTHPLRREAVLLIELVADCKVVGPLPIAAIWPPFVNVNHVEFAVVTELLAIPPPVGCLNQAAVIVVPITGPLARVVLGVQDAPF